MVDAGLPCFCFICRGGAPIEVGADAALLDSIFVVALGLIEDEENGIVVAVVD